MIARNFDDATDRGEQSRIVGVDKIYWSGPITVDFSTVRGDFSADGSVDVQDLDLLYQELRSPSPHSLFDLTGDQFVDEKDRDEMVRGILNTDYGDANLDGLFDASDLTTVFQASEYEDAIVGNSTWSEGDWDGDGDFTTSDLVLALQIGWYEIGAQAGRPQIAAAVEWLFSVNNLSFSFDGVVWGR